MKYSSRSARLAASFVDGLVIGIVKVFVDKMFPSAQILTTCAGVIYFCLMTYYEGATLGKKFFGIKVIAESGKLTWKNVLLRETVGKFVSGIVLGFGYIWILFDKRRQGWHDKIGKTLVIQIKPLTGIKKVTAYVLAGLFFLAPIFAILSIIFSLVMLASGGGIFTHNQLRNNQLQQYQVQPTPFQ